MRPKFLVIGLCLLLLGLLLPVGACTPCECGEWGAITVSSGNWQETVQCGGTIYAPSFVSTVDVTANYQCEPQKCEATFEWTVSTPTAAIANGRCGSSPCSFEFEFPGRCVEVSIKAYCGGTLCDECIFTVCPGAECKCGEWGTITVSAEGFQETVECGGEVEISVGVAVVNISADYLCEPQECKATYVWTAFTPAAVIDSGTCGPGSCAFELELPEGCFDVSIKAYCGGTLCDECIFTICPYFPTMDGGGQGAKGR